MSLLTGVDIPAVVGKRATHEAMTLHPRVGYVVVENASHASGGHTYEVTIEDGEPVSCSCPDYQYRREDDGEACKHITRVALAEPVIEVADPSVTSS